MVKKSCPTSASSGSEFTSSRLLRGKRAVGKKFCRKSLSLIL